MKRKRKEQVSYEEIRLFFDKNILPLVKEELKRLDAHVWYEAWYDFYDSMIESFAPYIMDIQKAKISAMIIARAIIDAHNTYFKNEGKINAKFRL